MFNMVYEKLKSIFDLYFFKRAWRKRNQHNFTKAKSVFPIDQVQVGIKTYGSLNVKSFGHKDERLVIGSFCSIAEEVKFLLGGEHSYKGVSTYPFKEYICGIAENTLTKGPIIIKDDVWIGDRCLILSGVTIGQGAIIAAGSVVAKDIPPYAIFAGGKILKYRFPEEIRERLEHFDFSKLDDSSIKNNMDLLYTELNTSMFENEFYKKHLK